jgi:rhodanese-related sulfurtransferase
MYRLSLFKLKITPRFWVWTLFTAFLLLLVQVNGCVGAGPASTASASPTPAQTTAPPAETAPANTAVLTEIDVQSAHDLIRKNQDNPDFIIIDVRTATEFNNGHLAGAINIDFYSPDFKSSIDRLARNKEYLIYCLTGIRGAAAIRIMIDLGFNTVHNLSGGITQWMAAGYPTVQ